MTEGDSLEDYLTPHRESGDFDSEGKFTVNVQKARKKSAKYRFVSRGGAMLKILQAIVSERSLEQVSIVYNREITRVEFQLITPWKYKDLVTILSGRSGFKLRSLQHLEVALSSLALGAGYPVSLTGLSGTGTLYWDGAKVSATYPKAFRGSKYGMSISIGHFSHKEARPGWLQARTVANGRFLKLTEQIRERFFSSSKTLSLDGLALRPIADFAARRQRDITHSSPWGEGAFAEWSEQEVRAQGCEAPRIRHAFLSAYQIVRKAHLREPNVTLVKFLWGPSICYWLKDGVLVGEDAFSRPPQSVICSIFADAEGLETDIGTLSLVKSKARERRLNNVESWVAENLPSYVRAPVTARQVDFLVGSSRSERAVYGGAAFGAVSLGLALATLITNPGLVWMTPALVMKYGLYSGAGGSVLGALSAPEDGFEQEPNLEEQLPDKYERFRESWQPNDSLSR